MSIEDMVMALQVAAAIRNGRPLDRETLAQMAATAAEARQQLALAVNNYAKNHEARR